MSEDRTNKVFRNKFRYEGNSKKGGFIGRAVPIPNDILRAKPSEEGKIRERLQSTIKKLVENNASVEEIKEFLNKEEYKKYEQYIDRWIEDWIIRLNPDIKSVLVKSLNRNKEQQEIEEEMQKVNEKVYGLYKTQIQNSIKNEKESRERQIKKKQEEKSKEEER